MPELAFTLLLRLPDGHHPNTGSWIDWRYADRIVAPATYGDPHDDPPYKRYPGTREYFAPPVEGALFPRPAGKRSESARWIRRPPALSLALGKEDVPTFALRADLLEIVRVGLRPYVAFGIAHLDMPGNPSSDEMLSCAQILGTRYRPSSEAAPAFELRDGSTSHPLIGHTPLAELAKWLFGGAHPDLASRAYIFAAARVPPDISDAELPIWRRALGQGQTLADARAALTTDPRRDDDRVLRLGPTTATFFGRAAVHVHRGEPSGSLRNVRSYWSETVLFGLLQYSYVESYAKSLSRLGGHPLGAEIDDLFRQWLAFRNILWWHHPSFTTDIAERILRRVHRGLRTLRLYEELESGFATYVEARRHRAEESEGRALRSLQIYGAGFAAVSTGAAIMQALGQQYLRTAGDQILAAVSLAGLGATVIVLVITLQRVRSRRTTSS